MNKIIEKYQKTFFSALTKNDKKKIYFNNYMWHPFSYKKIQCLDGEDAINEFIKTNENEVFIFFEHNDVVREEKNVTLDKLFEILKNVEETNYYDCYVVSKDFTWTFITTHETVYDYGADHNIGPFFKRI